MEHNVGRTMYKFQSVANLKSNLQMRSSILEYANRNCNYVGKTRYYPCTNSSKVDLSSTRKDLVVASG